MKEQIASIIFCLLVGVATYLHNDNKVLKNAINRLEIEKQKLIRSEQNLKNYYLLKEKLSFCPMNDNSFVFQTIDFLWIDINFNELIQRLNNFYRYDRVALITSFDIKGEKTQDKETQSKTFKVSGFVIAPCR